MKKLNISKLRIKIYGRTIIRDYENIIKSMVINYKPKNKKFIFIYNVKDISECPLNSILVRKKIRKVGIRV